MIVQTVLAALSPALRVETIERQNNKGLAQPAVCLQREPRTLEFLFRVFLRWRVNIVQFAVGTLFAKKTLLLCCSAERKPMG